MSNLTYLLKELALIQKEYDFKRAQEEQFNIFSVLHKEHDERRLHSRFIAALLDPHGSHELGVAFLEQFIALLNEVLGEGTPASKIILDESQVVVYPEAWNKSEYKNIDILLLDKKSKKAVIIENKINAGDSITEAGGQLYRYYEYALNTERIPDQNIYLYYLTLDGHAPSTS